MKVTAALSALFVATLAAPNQHHGRSLLARETRETSINWSGAVVEGANITGITATFPVLETRIPTVNETGKDAYLATAWVGIDGYNATDDCPGLWQVGVQSEHHAQTGVVSFMVWYELYPAAPVFVDIGNVSAGDIIKVTLEVPTTTEATAVLENLSTGRGFNVTTDITSPLCLRSAEWIVERAYTLSGLAGLLDFGNETISNISYTAGGEVFTSIPDDVIITDIIDDELNDVQQTYTEVSEDSILITYLGS